MAVDSLDTLFAQARGTATPAGLLPGSASTADPLDSSWGQADARQAGLQMVGAAPNNPDRAGQANQLSRDTGMPADTIERNLSAVQAQQQAARNATLLGQNPKLAGWASDPRHAAVSGDDLGLLARIGHSVVNVGKAIGGALLAGVADLEEGGYGLAEMAAQGPLNILAQAGGLNLTSRVTDRNVQWMQARRRAAAAAADAVRPQTGGPISQGLLSGIESLPNSAGALVASMVAGPEAGLAMMGATQGGQSYGQARDAGLSPARAMLFGASQGAVEAGTELPAYGFLTKSLGRVGFGKFLSGFIGRELGGEELATGLQDLNDWAVLHPEQPLTDYAREHAGDPLQTALGVVATAGAMETVNLGLHAAHRRAEARAATDGLAATDTTMAQAARSKTRDRDPEAFRQFLAAHTENTASENLYVPAERLREFFQSDHFDPDDAAHAWLQGFSDQVNEAAPLGGDVVIPTADAVTHLAGTAAWDAIRPDVRLSPGGMSDREARSFDADLSDHLERQGAELAAQHRADEEARAPERKVFDAVFSQLRQAGFTPDAATSYASLWQARYVARADQLGTDAHTAYTQANTTIRQDAPAIVQGYRSADQMDLLINAMRGKQATTRRGPSLLEWISRQGGVEDPGGDIASMGGADWHKEKAFRRRLIRDGADRRQESFAGADGTATGYGQDDFAHRAWEVGYFPDRTERPTTNDLLDAIGDELRGTPRYSAGYSEAERETREATGKAADSLRAFLANAGLDPETASREQIDAALADDEAQRGLEQDGKPVATISGDEIAPADASVATLRQAARDYYKENLRGTVVHSEALGRDVRFASGRKAFSSSANPEKLRLFAALRAVIAHGRVLRSQTPADQSAEPSTKAYHTLEADIRVAGEDKAVVVTVREDASGDLYYNHNLKESAAGNPEDTAYKAGPGEASRTLRQNIAADGLNINVRSLDRTARGRIDLFDDGRRVIHLFEGRDLSTVLHESGHLWLEELAADASSPDAPQQLRDDWATVQRWFADNGHAIGEDGTVPTDAHELWARGFERYAMEGKAPSIGLRQAFDRFRSWLLRLYQVVDNLRTPLTDEVRAVFGRMLATQDEVDAATRRQHLQALFSDAAQAGMTEEEFAGYSQAATSARSEAYDALLYRTMEAVRRQRTEAWKTEERGVRDDVEARINARPEFQALHLLRTGRWLGDAEREGLSAKLDRQWLVGQYGADALSLMPKGVPPIYAERGTTSADDMAELVGARSGDDLVRALMGIEQSQRAMRENGDKRSLRRRLIDEETATEMRERHGDVLTDGSIEEEALAAVHNSRKGELIAAETRALARRAGNTPTPLSLAREWARGKIASGRVVDVASGSAMQRYARATGTAARLAEAAMLRGDVDETFRQKQAQLLNHALLSEAKTAADEVTSAVKRLYRLGRRRTIASVDQNYLDRAHAQLERFDFRPRSQTAIDEQASFATWAEQQQANGVDMVVPPRLESNGEHYSRISVDELRGLRDSVDQIVHLGRFKQTLIDGKEQRAFEAVVAEAVGNAAALPQRAASDLMEPGWLDRFKAGVAGADAALLKMEQVFDWLDGGKAEGVFNRVAFRPMAEAQDRENDMMADYLGRVRGALSAIDQGVLKRWSEKVALPELINRDTGRPWVMTRQQLVSMALNMGNAGNVQRLVDGYGWNEQAVRDVLNRELSQSEWQFVQRIWDVFDTLWSSISAMERRINGFAPEKVQAVPLDTPAGQLAGGYFPAVYDSTKSLDAEAHAGRSADLFETTYTRATTRASATNERVQRVTRPILLDLGVINRHLGETIHDITHREAVMNADRFLSNKSVMAAVDKSLGPAIRQQFRPWLKFVANRWAMERAGNEGLGKFLNKARANTTVVGMGYRITTIVSQLAGYANSAEYVGGKHMADAIAASARDPIGSFRFAKERSGEVRHRMDTLDRDIGNGIRQLAGRSDPLSAAKRFAFHGIGYMDRVVAVPTWLGGYNKAVAAGATEEQAIYEGDKAVRLSQGAGSAKDLAAIQRGAGKHGELLKLFSMFYSYLSALYQRERTLGRDVGQAVSSRRTRDLPALMARAWWLIAVPPVLTELLSGRGPDDDEDWGWWAFRKMVVNALGPIPLLREVIEPAWLKLEGRQAFDPDISPLQRALKSVTLSAADANKALTGQPTHHATRDTLELAGYTTGLVPGQLASASQFLVDVGQGDQQPQDVAEWYRGLTTGKAVPAKR